MSFDLCEELILEIFLRLPTKSLVRFRSVSKSLYACIGSRRFIRMHALRSPNKLMVIHQIEYGGGTSYEDMYTLHSGGQLSSYNSSYIDIDAVEYPFLNFKVVGSCNGVVCLHHYQNITNLWNPSIRRKVTVPKFPFRPSECSTYPIGFGFDPIIDDYKILMRAISETTKGDEPDTFVYTMKTNTWREIPSPTSPFYAVKSLQCPFKGSLHWVVKWYLTDSRDDSLSYSYILKFDLSSEVFSSIQLPELSWETTQMTIIKDSLAVISLKHDGHSLIWVRRRECNDDTISSWSVAYKLSTHEFGREHRVFQLTPNGDLVIKPFYSGIINYNPETGARSGFVGLSGSLGELLVTPCVESLELLDMGTSCDQGKKQVTKERKRTE